MLSKEEAISMALKKREELLKEKFPSNSRNFYLLDIDSFKDKQNWISFENRQCYADIHYGHKYKPIIMVDIECKRHSKYEKHIIQYVDYIINRSIFNNAFITKNAKGLLEKGAILDCTYPAQYVISAGMTIRAIEEYPEAIQNFSKFKRHISEDQALVLSNFFIKHTYDLYILTQGLNTHGWVNRNFSIEFWRKFLKRNLNSMKHLPPMSDNMNYKNIGRYIEKDYKYLFSSTNNLKFPNLEIIETKVGWKTNKIQGLKTENIKYWLNETLELNGFI